MQVIINADDFGLNDSVNAAIVECYRFGTISSTSLMVNTGGFQNAVSEMASTPGLGVGLHFNLTSGIAISGSQHIIQSRMSILRSLVTGLISQAQIQDELHAQLCAFGETGRAPTHIDTHQHIHLIPAIFEVLSRYCMQHQVPLRIPWVPVLGVPGTMRKRVKGFLSTRLIKHNLRKAQGDIICNHGLVSIFDISRTPALAALADYELMLDSISVDGTEVMVHPKLPGFDELEGTSISAISENEFGIMTSDAFRAALTNRHIELISYADLANKGLSKKTGNT
jgi:chitin disaccharide deacetylase